MCKKYAPANALLKAVDNCSLTFEHNSTKKKWYSCAYCKTNQMPAELYVGDVLDGSESSILRPEVNSITKLDRHFHGMFGLIFGT